MLRLFRELAGQLIDLGALVRSPHTEYRGAAALFSVWDEAPHVLCVRAWTVSWGRDTYKRIWAQIVRTRNYTGKSVSTLTKIARHDPAELCDILASA